MNTTQAGARARAMPPGPNQSKVVQEKAIKEFKATGRLSDARFLLVFMAYAGPGEWVTSRRLAERIVPPAPTPEFCKEVSRKLSNLNRFGHLERQRVARDGLEFEYRRTVDAPAVKLRWWRGLVGGPR